MRSSLPHLSLTIALLLSVTPASAQVDVHQLAQRIDRHYNHLSSLRSDYTERYSGMGQVREEHGTLLLKKPGRMRWNYADGKVFVLDGKYAISYTPGDVEAQRVPAKQLDDLRSPVRFLLGHTQLEKELDHLSATSSRDGVTLSGSPRYQMGAGQQRIQTISVTADPTSGMIRGLRITEIDGSFTAFTFLSMQENVPANDGDFHFTAPPGVAIVDGPSPE